MSPYDARCVANLLLARFNSKTCALSNKKINKILYYIHAVGLVRLERPLIKNHFEAWDHGPVVAVVYQAFKTFENKPITGPATAFDYSTGCEQPIAYDNISPEDAQLIITVAEYFMKFTADELEDMTHRSGGPWATIRAANGSDRGIRNRIPDQVIAEHFQQKFGPKQLN